MHHPKPHSEHGGFTLIEIVVSFLVVGILSVVGANMLSDTFRISSAVVRETLGVGYARYTLERLAREIREAQLVTSSTNTSFSFTNNNGTIVSITKIGSTVFLSVGGVNQTLINNVNAFGLTYRDSDLVVATSPNTIRFVDITLTVIPVDSPDVSPNFGPSVAMSTRIALRTPT